MGYVIGDKKYLVQAVYFSSKVEVYNRALPPYEEVNDIPDVISDSIVNLTNEKQLVRYIITPILYENRDGKEEGRLCSRDGRMRTYLKMILPGT